MADEKVMEWIQRDLDGDLTAAEKKMLEKQLEQSPQCRATAEEMQWLSGELSLLPKVEPPHSVVDAVLEAIEDDKKKTKPQTVIKPRYNWLRLGRMAAALVLFLFIGLFYLSKWGGIPINTASKIADPVPPEHTDGSKDRAAKFELENIQEVWSPDRQYCAIWQGNHLIVRKADGSVQYRSRIFRKVDGSPSVVWQNKQRVRLILPSADGKDDQTVMIDVKEKKEIN
ncbi:zf-HC2 domain-containing protein [Thermoactinomyces daqus]|uniref:Zf-HC2 domain-containing protein n=1 Tax=Thermoactinomyces daqus TaxID=1329516 RepID=A0A7W1X9N8_9BACL|nr:zf-HC2 domain-containing protein [Thermoactinomyces daqus]MBA4542665.1 zf-HC2 domain-containing protein [Thermoactinomyces daqus]